ncbi:MAG: alpha-L-fucosidase [Bacteroidales bacterium]
MVTYTNMEWGMGDEKTEWFNPTELDCRQWAKVCKDAGMKGMIIVAKHHDGFCLWPSAYTEHSVKNSPWKDGKGDVVKEMSDACREYGLKFGVYLSPWDRNHADYGKSEYVSYFRNQLTELLTNYGEVFEVWFDGANGGTGYYGGANENRIIDNKTYYDWDSTFQLVRQLQPNACMFSDAGPDVRWVGNEEGWAMETNWAPIRRAEYYPGSPISKESNMRTGQEDGTHWVPAEVDVSVRPGWFYHPSEDHKVKSLPHLLDIYYNSIGRNASLLLSFPIDRRGLIHERDVEQVMKLKAAIDADFAKSLAKNRQVEATNVRGRSNIYKASNVTDGKPETYWATDDNIVKSSLTIDLIDPTEFNRLLVQEYIRLGQRVNKFSLEALVDDEWKKIAGATTVGAKRILRFPNIIATKIRLNIEDAKACPIISNVELYKAPKVLEAPRVQRSRSGEVIISAFDSDVNIYYTLDGTEPSKKSEKYTEPLSIKHKTTLKAIIIDPRTKQSSPVSVVDFDISREKWNLLGNNASEEEASFIFDGNETSTWVVKSDKPMEYVIDLGEELQLMGFLYLPDQRRGSRGIITSFEFYVSTDGKKWGSAVSSGEFSNIENSPIWQRKTFREVTGRFVKFKALSSAGYNQNFGVAELDIISSACR